MGREFHGHPARELGLKGNAVVFESRHYVFSLLRSENADKNVRALEIGGDVNVIDGDKRPLKTDFARKDSAQFPFYDFVDPQHSMFHTALSFPSQFLGHRLELITLDDVAHVIFAEIAELDTAFQSGANFLHVVLEPAQGRNSAVVDRLAFACDARASGARDSAVGHQTTGDDASAQFENLFDLGVAEHGFAELRLEHTRHRVLDLVDQLVNDAVKLDLNAFALRGRDRHVFDFDVKSDDDSVRGARQQNIRFRNRPDCCVDNVEIDFLALDLLQCGSDRLDRTLGVAFQDKTQRFLAVRGFE